MLHKKTYLLLVLSSISSIIFAQKTNQAQFIDEYNPSLWSERKIKLELVKLKENEWGKDILRSSIKGLMIYFSIKAIKEAYKRYQNEESFFADGTLLGYVGLEFGLYIFFKFIDNSIAWTKEDIDDIQKEVDQRNADVSPKELIFFSTNK